MNKNDNSGPAFACPETLTLDGRVADFKQEGLTKRQYFAAHAPKEVFVCVPDTVIDCMKELELDAPYAYQTHYPMLLAKCAVRYADALIAELNKERP